MKRRIMVLVFALAALQPAWAEIVAGDEQYSGRVKQQWAELVAPSASFTPVLLFLVVLSIIGVARCARSKAIPILSPSFLIPPIFLAFVLLFFTHVPATFAEMYGDFGLPFRDLGVWVRVPFTLGSRWYGPVFLSAVWVATHPVVLRPRAGASRSRRILLFLPCIGGTLLPIAWFVLTGMTPCFGM